MTTIAIAIGQPKKGQSSHEQAKTTPTTPEGTE
jgi:hypothetical protein